METFLAALDDFIGSRVEVGLETGDLVGTLLGVEGTFIRLATTDTVGYDYGTSSGIMTVNLEFVGFVRILT